MENDEIKKLVQQTIRQNDEILELVKKIRRFTVWQEILGIVKVVIIVVPIILAIFYALPYLKQAMSMYGQIMNFTSGGNQLKNAGDLLDNLQNFNGSGLNADMVKNLLK